MRYNFNIVVVTCWRWVKRRRSGRHEVNKFREAEIRGHMRQSPPSLLPQQQSCTLICAKANSTQALNCNLYPHEQFKDNQHVFQELLVLVLQPQITESRVLLSDAL
jgi:hypothetical protein